MTITGTAESPIVVELVEEGDYRDPKYLSAQGLFTLIGGSYAVETVELTIDTNTDRSYSKIRANDEVPTDEYLENMMAIGRESVETNGTQSWEIWKYYFDTFDVPWSPVSGYTFDYLAEGEYLNLTYRVNFRGPEGLGTGPVREIQIRISGANDGPVIEYNLTPGDKTYAILNISQVQNGGGILYRHGGVVQIPIVDLDHTDGNMTCEIVSVSGLDISNNPHIANYPEWPGLQGLKDAMSCEFNPNKEPLQTTDGRITLSVLFNDNARDEPQPGENHIDFTFLGPDERFSFEALVRVTDHGGDIAETTVPVYFNGWCDGASITYQNYDDQSQLITTSEIMDGSYRHYRIVEDNYDNAPHKIALYRYGNPGSYAENAHAIIYINLDDNTAPGANVYAFYKIDIDGRDRTNPKVFDEVHSTISTDIDNLDKIYGWPDLPQVKFAYNLSDDDVYNPAKYERLKSERINDVTLDVPGEYLSTLHVMILIPASAWEYDWPSSFAINGTVDRFTGLGGVRTGDTPGDVLSNQCTGLLSFHIFVNVTS